jgi:hypothetical protein
METFGRAGGTVRRPRRNEPRASTENARQGTCESVKNMHKCCHTDTLAAFLIKNSLSYGNIEHFLQKKKGVQRDTHVSAVATDCGPGGTDHE